MTDGTIFVRRLYNLPLTVRGVTTPNPDGTFSVYINAALPPEAQDAALRHEVYHIEHDHMYNLDPVAVNEREANERPARIVEQPVRPPKAASEGAAQASERPPARPVPAKPAVVLPGAAPAASAQAPRTALDDQTRRALHAWLDKRLYDVG